MNTTPHLDVPAPAGAIHVGEFRLDGGRIRQFRGTARKFPVMYGGSVTVEIVGEQTITGAVERFVGFVPAELPMLTAADALTLARQLFAAADEISGLAYADAKGER